MPNHNPHVGSRIETLIAQRAAKYETMRSILDSAPPSGELPNRASATFDAAEAEFDRLSEEIRAAQESSGWTGTTDNSLLNDGRGAQTVGAPAIGRHAVAKGELRSEFTYRPDKTDEVSFLRDVYTARQGDTQARERLARNESEAMSFHGVEYRDMVNGSTTGGEFVPPLYLGNLWVEPNVSRRPFADALPKLALPDYGTSIQIPKLSSGVSVAARSDGGAVSETDGVTASVTHDVNEIAGQVDVGRIAVMRSDPTLDLVIGRTLRRRHDSYFDTQLLSGSGTAPEHRGIRNVTGVNAVTYTDASPTAAELLPKVYDAVQQIASARKEVYADMLVMHPRRAAWLASNLSSTFPLFQQGGLNQAGGTQNAGFLETWSGLRVIIDPNIDTTLGAGTEDEIYVVASEDLLVMESPLFLKVWDDVGSGNGLIRFQVFSHSAFLSKRYPESISVISGTGLAAPTF